MSNQTVWVSYPSCIYMNSYDIGMRIPNLYNYADYRKAVLDSDADKLNQGKEEYAKSFIKSGRTIFNRIMNFKKFEALPDALYAEYADGDEYEKGFPSDYEYVFKILGGAMIVNEACANILKQFRLGDNTLTPLKIRNVFSDGVLYSGTVYFFNLCEIRNYVKIPQSHDKLYYSTTGAYPLYYDDRLYLDHNLLEIDKLALDCDVDIWHDQGFHGSIFFSDKLRQALIHANMLDKWNMKSCQLI